ncbi:hypothetical protein [Mucilaginibacter sp.]|uniref:hypothetical protein n=1 Tax=Mucilaginibacter sp. TaxID=1882438 RepID=UPI0035BC7A15
MDLTAEQIKLVNLVERFYSKPADAILPVLYSTGEIFSRLQSIYPSDQYNPEDVYMVMTYLQYETMPSTNNAIKWFVVEVC